MNSLSALIWPWRSSLNFLSAHSGLSALSAPTGGFPLDCGGLQLCLFHLSGFLFCRLCQLHPGSLLCRCPGFPQCLGSSLAHRSAGLSLVCRPTSTWSCPSSLPLVHLHTFYSEEHLKAAPKNGGGLCFVGLL